jgi:hypothetical protein
MKDRLNLLPKEFQDAMASVQRVKRWMIALGVMGIVGFGVLYQERQSLSKLEEEHKRILPEVESLRLLQTECEAAREKLNQLRTKHTLVSTLENELPVVQILGVFSRSAHDPERRIEVTDFRADEILRNLPVASARQKPANNRSAQKQEPEKVLAVIVTGIAQDDMIVARFVGKLRESQMFQSVKLNSTSGEREQTAPGRHFEVECVY